MRPELDGVKTTSAWGIALSLWLLPTPSTLGAELTFAQSSSLPPEVHQAFSNGDLGKKYVFSARLNPFFIQGDFDGDGHLDTAVLIESRSSSKTGIVVVHTARKQVFILGAGTAVAGSNGNDSFDWMDAWHAYAKRVVERGAGERKPPDLRGDALHVEKTESASAIIYWDGSGYRWFQQGD